MSVNGTYQSGISNSWGVSSVFQTYDNIAHIPPLAERGVFSDDLLRVPSGRPLLLGEDRQASSDLKEIEKSVGPVSFDQYIFVGRI